MTSYAIQTDGENQMADADVCLAVGEDLTKHYPGHPWMVGADHFAGTVVIDLGVDKPSPLRNFGYLLHISSILGPDGQKKVMRAGGELLERYGLARRGARADDGNKAREHGLDVSGSEDGDRWRAKHALDS